MGDVLTSGMLQYIAYFIPDQTPPPALEIVSPIFDDGITVPEDETWFVLSWTIDVLNVDTTTGGTAQALITCYNGPGDVQYHFDVTPVYNVSTGPLAMPIFTRQPTMPLIAPGGSTFYLDLILSKAVAGSYSGVQRTVYVSRMRGPLASAEFIPPYPPFGP